MKWIEEAEVRVRAGDEEATVYVTVVQKGLLCVSCVKILQHALKQSFPSQ